jgi:hypothetical protein
MHCFNSLRTDGCKWLPAAKIVRLSSVRATVVDREGVTPGPSGAFTPGKEAEARRQLFNRIAPVYDDVGC